MMYQPTIIVIITNIILISRNSIDGKLIGQDDDPLVDHVPGAQFMHAALDVAPITVDQVPALQTVQPSALFVDQVPAPPHNLQNSWVVR